MKRKHNKLACWTKRTYDGLIFISVSSVLILAIYWLLSCVYYSVHDFFFPPMWFEKHLGEDIVGSLELVGLFSWFVYWSWNWSHKECKD